MPKQTTRRIHKKKQCQTKKKLKRHTNDSQKTSWSTTTPKNNVQPNLVNSNIELKKFLNNIEIFEIFKNLLKINI